MDQQQYYIHTPNQEKKVAGPYSLEEVLKKYENGEIKGTTLVSREGGEKWVQARMLDPKNRDLEVGPCPYCGATLHLEEYNLPETCPSCGQQLRLPSYDFSSCVKAAFRKYCTFRGRATRAEYWYFVLFTFMISLPLGLMDYPYESIAFEDYDTTAWVITGISWAFTLGILLPSLAVSVRRMHDRGLSGLWILLVAVMQILTNILPLFLLSEGSLPKLVTLLIFGILFLAFLVTGIFVVVQSAMDSQKGTNAYGPSAKYPIG